ncbi:ParM/StbA family protein [Halobacillus locisalis]|uniref:ParM/StbA family protein n=1 Tax=Halobacillus locisalis TaxID=220753 RepID=A0A838CYB5_9BACI|nr:ParM/StbA family protein [Halobacillus locisalis]MBA2176884.1 ParM/StbA family protein [Halobacillus locisalis]
MTKREMVAVDVGYGYVKAIASNGNRVLFPAVVGSGRDRALANFMNQDATSNEVTMDLDELHVKIAEKHYYIGEMAIKNSSDASRVFEKERYKHEYTNILMNVAIHLVADADTEEVILFTGLPLNYYKDQKEAFQNKLEEPKPAIEWMNGNTFEGNRHINIHQAKVFPQGMSAIWAALMNHDGKSFNAELMQEGNQIAVIDIGFRTTDVCVIEMKAGGAFSTLFPLSDTIDQGVVNLYSNIRLAYQNKTGGSTISDAKINRILKQKNINYKGKRFDMANEVEASFESVNNSIVDEIKKLWKEESDTFDQIFVVGGGGSLFFEHLQKSFDDRLKQIVDSQYANPIGYYRIGKLLMGELTSRRIAQ